MLDFETGPMEVLRREDFFSSLDIKITPKERKIVFEVES